MRIRLLILTLLIIGVHQHIQAQYMLMNSDNQQG